MSSTLYFPYTTLFRSSLDDAPVGLPREQRRSALHHQQRLAAEVPRQRAIEHGGIELAQRVAGGIRKVHYHEVEHVAVLTQDRKSTRLNSSHANISHAV